MEKQAGDLHLRIVLAGEPSVVRSAFNDRFIDYAEGASIRFHWPVRFARWPKHGSSGVVELGNITRTSKADAEAALSHVCDKMESGDIAYASRLIDVVHRAIANRNHMVSLGTHPRFWLRVDLQGDAARLRDAIKNTLRIAAFWDYVPSIYVREGRPLRAVLRSFDALDAVRTLTREHAEAANRLLSDMSAMMEKARNAREAVIAVRARAVLRDLADDWLVNGRSMNHTQWQYFRYRDGFWQDLVELDFLEANFDQYRQLRRKALEDEAAREARFNAETSWPFDTTEQ